MSDPRDEAGDGERAGADPSPGGRPGEEEADEAAPRINFDRYRAHSPRSNTSYLIVASLMLVSLVLIVMFKDSCGSAVTRMMGVEDPAGGRPAVKIKLDPPKP